MLQIFIVCVWLFYYVIKLNYNLIEHIEGWIKFMITRGIQIKASDKIYNNYYIIHSF